MEVDLVRRLICDICGQDYVAYWRLVGDYHDHIVVASYCPNCRWETERRRVRKEDDEGGN